MMHPAKAIVIGASAGALDALTRILPGLPKGYPWPVIVVVHVPADRRSIMADLMAAKCALPVVEAEDKTPIEAGTVYFAPPDYHLQVEETGLFSLSADEPVLFSRPSIDVLFDTAAFAYGAGLTGVILTGANNDGAAGLRAIMDAGGRGLVQNPQDAYAAAMPQAALSLCPGAEPLSLEQIAQRLQDMAGE